MHIAALLNQGRAIRFLAQRGATTKCKNADNHLPMKIATLHKNKEAKKAIRLIEKKHYQSNALRASQIRLYDWLQEHSDRLLRRCHQLEDSVPHRVSSFDLRKLITEQGFTGMTSDDLNELILRHETNPNEVDYQTFLSGKVFIEKPFLLSAFTPKSNKKKKKKKKKKAKNQVPIPIAIQSEGPRTANGNPPIVYVKKHQFVTDTNRFSRDRLPEHALADDSTYCIDPIHPQFVHIHNAGKRQLLTFQVPFSQLIEAICIHCWMPWNPVGDPWLHSAPEHKLSGS